MVHKDWCLMITLVNLHTMSMLCQNMTATDLAIILLVKSARILRPANPQHALHSFRSEKRKAFHFWCRTP